MPTMDIQVPMISKKPKPTTSSSSSIGQQTSTTNKTTLALYNHLTGSGDQNAHRIPEEENQEQESEETDKTTSRSFNFVIMTKKGNKTQYHSMEVPVASEFAQQFRAREEVCLKPNFKKTSIFFCD